MLLHACLLGVHCSKEHLTLTIISTVLRNAYGKGFFLITSQVKQEASLKRLHRKLYVQSTQNYVFFA